ncbi:MAG: dephospho-CoA kinase [Gammaproteobacteria bacterium]|nr:dephospho-CoA kinase [Gammaproteobacteria bacterium]MYF31305.1 dephospho-CoA kinase [Gammaproteobacteria bacterium]MYK47790.1 dephospho-CoA kinase [Gammaproteobacteria bacterium]
MKQTPLVVGIAGGIGSGKTAVSDQFRSLGVEIADADVASRRVVEPGQPALETIAHRFGADVLLGDGTLNRAFLRERVFQNAGERRWLESLLHPLINQWIRDVLAGAPSPYAILVNPLMRQRDPRADRILVVDVAEATQIRRAVARDGVAESQVRAILASQIDRRSRLRLADDVISNDGSLEDLHRAVDRLHECYLKAAMNS